MHEAFSLSISDKLKFWPLHDSHLVQSIEERFYPNAKKAEIARTFQRVKEKIITYVERSAEGKSQDVSQARQVLNGIDLYWPMERMGQEGFTGNYLQSMVTSENAAYSSENNRIKINVPYLSAPLWKQMWTLSHEIGHAIDLSSNRIPEFWKHLKACFEKKGFEETQMGETFSDWLAAEILMEFLKEPSLSLSESEKREAVLTSVWLCRAAEEQELMDPLTGNPDVHPPDWKRINTILRAHPYFNQLFGCASSPSYCSGELP